MLIDEQIPDVSLVQGKTNAFVRSPVKVSPNLMKCCNWNIVERGYHTIMSMEKHLQPETVL
jgi:hypothetical protein